MARSAALVCIVVFLASTALAAALVILLVVTETPGGLLAIVAVGLVVPVALLSWARAEPLTDARWRVFARRYRREMAAPLPRRLISLLAAVSGTASLSIGCFCEDEARCHRSLLRAMLVEADATIE